MPKTPGSGYVLVGPWLSLGDLLTTPLHQYVASLPNLWMAISLADVTDQHSACIYGDMAIEAAFIAARKTMMNSNPSAGLNETVRSLERLTVGTSAA